MGNGTPTGEWCIVGITRQWITSGTLPQYWGLVGNGCRVHIASLQGSSGQWNSCCTPPHSLGVLGSGNPAVEVEVEVSRGMYRAGGHLEGYRTLLCRGCPALIGLRATLPCSPPRPALSALPLRVCPHPSTPGGACPTPPSIAVGCLPLWLLVLACPFTRTLTRLFAPHRALAAAHAALGAPLVHSPRSGRHVHPPTPRLGLLWSVHF